MTIESGALEQAYVKVEGGGYGTLAAGTPAATDGIRHLTLAMTKKNNREASPQKRGTPDTAQSLPRRPSASWDLGAAMWEPSGTLGTASYFGPMLKAAFGSQTTPNLATTIASGAATTGATLTSGAGLAVNDLAVVTLGTGARREITRLKTVAGAVVTWDALSAIPDTPGAVVSGVNFKPASLLTDSLSIYLFHTGGGFKRAVIGAIVNKVEFTFDGTKEVQVAMSGPAKDLVRTGITLPGAHTTVGSPASGLVGNFYLDGVAFLVSEAKVTLENSEGLRNIELGTSTATGHFRESRRKVTCGCSFYLEDVTLIATAEAAGTGASGQDVFRILVGQTNGSMVGMVLPKVEWEIPEIPTNDGPLIVSAEGVAYATSGNDEVFAGEM
jgi:hypothetical protein